MAWTITANKAGKFTAQTSGKYVDRDIDFVVPAGGCSVTGGTVSATAGTASASTSQTGMTDGISSTATAYYVTASAEATGGNASITDVKDAHTAGWVDAKSATTVITGASKTGANDSKSSTTYLKASTITATGSATTSVNLDTNTTNTTVKTTTSGDYKVKVNASGTYKANASDTAGYTPGNTATEASGAATGSSKTIYIQAATTGTSNSGTNVSSINPSASAQYVNITEGYTPARKWTINAVSKNTAIGIVGNGAVSTASSTDDVSGFTTTNTTAVVPSGGYLTMTEGYYPATKISLATLIPDTYTGKTLATTGSMRSGYFAWDKDGAAILGTMGNATVKSGNASISKIAAAYNSTGGVFDISVTTGSIAAPSVSAGGYIDSSTGTKQTNSTINSTATLAKIAGTVTADVTADASASGGALSLGSKGSGTWTDAADTTGTLKTDKDSVTSGVYVKVDRAAMTATASATATAPSVSITTDGYGTSANHGLTATGDTDNDTDTIPAGSLYVPIKGGSVTVSNGSVTTSPKVTLGNSATGVTTSATDKGYKVTFTATPTNGTVGKATSSVTAGWVSSATNPSSNITVTPTVDGSGTTTSGVRTVDVYLDTTSVTKTISTSAVQNAGSVTYTTTGVLETAPSSVPYFSLTAGANGTAGKVYTGASNSTTAGSKPVKYIEIYSGSYTYSAS